jgi:hypothetical protein
MPAHNNQNAEEYFMFVFAIETCGRTVAFTKETDRIMLGAILSGEREEGQHLLDGLSLMRDSIGPLWDGKAPITARLATDSEEIDYDITVGEFMEKEPGVRTDESILMFNLTNQNGDSVLVIPPAMARMPN